MNQDTSTNLFLKTILVVSSLETVLFLRNNKICEPITIVHFPIFYLLNFLYSGQLFYVNQCEISF